MFDLSKVAGMKLYTGPPEGRKLLAKYGMVITSETRNRLFIHYHGPVLPTFITTDTAVRAFNEIFQEGFEKLERRQAVRLKKTLVKFWSPLAAGRVGKDGPAITGPGRLGGATVIATAMKLMNPKWQPKTAAGKKLYKQIAKDVTTELKRISDEKIVPNAPLFARDIDYSLCKPKSFYVGNKQLERFYRARTFLAFPMGLKDDKVLQTALVLGCIGYETEIIDKFLWPYRRLLGDLNLRNVGCTVPTEKDGVEFDNDRIKRLFAGKGLNELRKELRKEGLGEYPIHIFVTMGEANRDAKHKPLLTAVLPKYATSDTKMMQQCIWPVFPKRFLPSGLDVLACCGNERAKRHLLDQTPKEIRKALAKRIAEITKIVKTAKNDDDAWNDDDDDEISDLRNKSEIWGLWGRIFDTLTDPKLTKRHPKFMSTTAYADKSLNTAMCGWVGYRHTFQLQIEDLGCAWGEPDPPEAGYVEPNLRFWDEMIKVSLDAQELLGEYDAAVGRLAGLTRMCMKAKEIATRQLAGKKLTEEQREWVLGFDSMLASLYGSRGNTLDGAADRSIVATISSDREGQQALHVGLAKPRTIYVIIDYGGKLQLARGGVMSYREFWRPLSKGRLTDQQWRKMIKEGKTPKPPKWLADISAEKRVKKEQ